MNIIEKEKARQEEFLEEFKTSCEDSEGIELIGMVASHKQSLINLKEYMEEIQIIHEETGNCGCNDAHGGFGNQIYDDIEELTKLIEAYE